MAPAANPVICAASATGPQGAVYRGPECGFAQAVLLRKAGKDVVVCDGTTSENEGLALQIEEAVVGIGNTLLHRAHVAIAGPRALPHYQPQNRPPDGHSFFETRIRKAIR